MTGYTISAKPTEYKGVMFRSRLEATWAAFFDLIGWRWDYEPVDLNGWVPDFIIRGAYRDVLVEVKPEPGMLNEALAKILGAAPDACIMLLENGPISRHGSYGDELLDSGLSTQIGWVWSPFHKERGRTECFQLSLAENEISGGWDAHIDGERYVGFHSGLNIDGEDSQFTAFGDLRPLWAKATNITRWKGPR